MKKLHRGPTIVLTLVPALAAGLAIGLIINASEKASQNKVSEEDKKYLAEINTLLADYGKDYGIPHNVIMSLKNVGYNVLSHKLSNANFEFAFDAAVKRFIIMYGDKILAKPDGYEMTNSQTVFKFTNKYDKDSKYGQYLLDDYDWTDPTAKFEIKASIDVGNNTNIKNMWYTPDNSNSSNVRVMRTYCEYLRFQQNSDTIYHFGESNNTEVYGASTSAPCNYIESGGAAYLYVENTTLQVVITNKVDAVQIDVLETGDGVTKGKVFRPDLVTMLIGNEIPEVEKTVVETTEVDTFQKLSEAITSNKKFIRLTDNITISGITESLSIADKSYVLDLNRKSIIDEATTLADAKPLINITAESEDSSLILIDCWREGSITLNNHYINVQGNINNGKKTAALYLEGANITFTSMASRDGAIEAGIKSTTSSGKQYSRVYMYGGIISANTTSTTHDIEVAGIYANNDALIQMNYGAIYSSINCVRTNGTYPNSIINIVDGTLKALSSVGECIYLPTGRLNISGGTLEGATVIGMRGGDVNISGGYLHATGEPQDYEVQGTSSGISCDGSVICVKLYGGATTNAYGFGLKISVSNATLQSDKSYILQVYRDDSTTTINQYLDTTFINGIYYYDHDVTDPTYNGVRISSKVDDDFYKIYQNGGSWIKTGSN